MAEKTKANLILDFETGDTPDGSDFTNLIESQVNLAETTVQSMTGGLTAPSLGATSVSAVNMIAGNIAVTGGVSAQAGEFGTLAVSGQSTFADVSASAMNITGTVSAAKVVATTVKTVSLVVSADARIHGDLRVDGTFILSQGESGEIYAATTAGVSASAAYVNVFADATSDSVFLVNFEASANRLVYKGTTSGNFIAHGIISVVASGPNISTFLTILVDNSAQERSVVNVNVGTSELEMQTVAMVHLSPESTVTLGIRTVDAAAAGWAIHRANFIVKE